MMDDLIHRQDAIELVHSLYPSAPIVRINRERWKEKYKPYIEVEKMLEMLPSVQPEIIRCENCRRRDDKWEDWEEGKVYWCDVMDGCVKADDYCSYAERRAGDENDNTGRDQSIKSYTKRICY